MARSPGWGHRAGQQPQVQIVAGTHLSPEGNAVQSRGRCGEMLLQLRHLLLQLPHLQVHLVHLVSQLLPAGVPLQGLPQHLDVGSRQGAAGSERGAGGGAGRGSRQGVKNQHRARPLLASEGQVQ